MKPYDPKCSGKIPFKTADDARVGMIHAKTNTRRYKQGRMEIYKCDCGFYHWGHNMKRKP